MVTGLLLAYCGCTYAAEDVTEALAKIHRSLPDIQWNSETVHAADFDGDGVTDIAVVGVDEKHAVVAIALRRSDGYDVSHIRFSTRGSIEQFASCGVPVELTSRSRHKSLVEDLGWFPDGYETCLECMEIVVANSGCDPIVLYWNHSKETIGWWRF